MTAHGGGRPGKPCFDYHVGKGPGPCVGAITREEYAEHGRARSQAFLEGRHGARSSATSSARCATASADLDFERAATLPQPPRGRALGAGAPGDRERDGARRGRRRRLCREETIAAAHVVRVREGRVLGASEFVLDQGLDVSDAELVEGFLLRYYDAASHVPREVLVAGAAVGGRGARGVARPAAAAPRCASAVPERGEKRRLLDLATTNARHALMRYKFRTPLRRGAPEPGAARAGERARAARAAAAHRVLRHLDAARPALGGVDGRVRRRDAPRPGAYRRFQRPRRDGGGERRRDDARGAASAGSAREAAEGEPLRRARPTSSSSTAASRSCRRRAPCSRSIGVDGRPGGGAREARGGAVRARLGRAGRAARPARRRSISSSASATRRTASPSRTTASCAARR